jgi:hypothetical protein
MPAALRHWDELLPLDGKSPKPTESLVLSFFSDERPLRGAAGLADWRLCGRLSRLIMAGHCSGERGESLIMPAGQRLPFERIFIFGLGSGEGFHDGMLAEHAKWMGEVLQRAGVKDYAVQVPGRATGLIGARRAAEIWRNEAGSGGEVTLMDDEGTEKTMGDVLVTH